MKKDELKEPIEEQEPKEPLSLEDRVGELESQMTVIMLMLIKLVAGMAQFAESFVNHVKDKPDQYN